jgi:hypothetical protein
MKTLIAPALMAVLIAAGCGRSEDVNSSSTPAQQAPPPAPTAEAPTLPAKTSPGADVASYPQQVTQSGTVKLTQPIKVYQAADASSTLVTRLDAGTVLEKKASYGDWLLVNWPSGVGEVSPGWVQASLIAQAYVDAGVPPAPDGGFLPDASRLDDDPPPPRPSIIPPPTRQTAAPATPATPTPSAPQTSKRPTFKVTPKP